MNSSFETIGWMRSGAAGLTRADRAIRRDLSQRVRARIADASGAADAGSRSRLSTYLEEHAYAMVDLSQGYDRYWANLTGNMRRKVNQRTRKD